MCDKNCDNCFYCERINGGMKYCGYLFKTHHKRPCEAGSACTVKVSRSVYRKKKRTPEEVEKYREKQRAKYKVYYETHKDKINARAKARREQKKEAICGS